MKATTRKHSAKRTFAGVLAAITLATAAVPVAAQAGILTGITASAASDDSFRIEDGKIILDDDLNTMKDVTAKTIFKILEDVPYCKFVVPALEGLLDTYVGTEDPTQQKLDEINGKLSTLFEKLDKMEQSIKNLLQNELQMSGFYAAYVSFKADTEFLSRKINETMNSTTLSNADKLAKIGSLAGSFKVWKENFDKSLTILNTYITDTSLGRNTSIFDVIYNNSCENVMFANEAIAKAKPVCEAIVQTYTAGCTAIIECLAAQLYVNNLSDDVRAQINGKYLSEIDASDEEIINEIQSVFRHIVSEDNGNITFAALCENTFKNKTKTTLVNHGLCSINLQATLFTQDFKDIPTKCNAGNDSKKEAEKQVNWFNDNVVKGQISNDYVKDIAAYAASKGKTIRQLLNENGFDTSKIKKDTYIITEKAFSKCYSASYNGFEDKSDAIFKGINIDGQLKLDKNGKVSDQEVKFWKIGWEGIKTIISATVNRWNSSFDGNACRFQLANTRLEIRGPKLSQIGTGGNIDISGPKGPQY